MPKNPFDLRKVESVILGVGEKPRKKRVQLTSTERLFIWEHPKKFGRICSICGEKITKLSDLELDHTKPYSKGGTKQALAHKLCNRMKARGSLGKIQKTMGFKTKKTKRKRQSKRKPKKKKPTDLFQIPEIKLPKGYL